MVNHNFPDATTKNRDIVFLFFTLLSLIGIFFFPRLHLNANTKIRLEDATFIALFLIVVLRILNGKFKLYKETIFPVIYFLYPLFLTFAIALTDIEKGIYSIVFWGKELQYYLFFLVFYYFFSKNKTDIISCLLVCLITINVSIGCYKIVTGVIDYYGIGVMFFEDSSSLSGLVYFGCTIICALLLYLRMIDNTLWRIYLYSLMVLSLICCLATGSKTSSFGVLTFASIFLVLHNCYAIRSISTLVLKMIKLCIYICLVAIFIHLLVHKWNYQIGNVDLRRLRNPIESMGVRYELDLKPKLNKLENNFDYLTGVGFLAGSTPGAPVSFGSSYDNQYLRNLLVMGIFGSGIWLIMLFYLGWALKGNRKLFVYYISLLGSYLAMGMGFEVFQLSKSGAIFWIVTGMLIGTRHWLKGGKSEVCEWQPKNDPPLG